MDEKSIARPVGADGLTALLAAGLGQRHGTSVSSGRFTGTAFGGYACQRWTTGGRNGMPVAAVSGIPTAVRVRKPVEGNVPGAPPRGAPV